MEVQPQPAPSRERPYQSRVLRSFAFVDLSGFTAFTDSEGDGAAVDVLMEFRFRLREIAARHGVRIAKWLGDGAMLVSVDAEPLTAAVADLGDALGGARLALRAGMASGPVILFEGDVDIGPAVNLAARLCDQAQPGEVLAAATLIAAVHNNTFTAIGAQPVAGFSEPVELFRLDRHGLIR